MPKNTTVDNYVDIDNCVYLGCRATPAKYIARVKLPDGTVITAWSDDKPSLKINDACSVNHKAETPDYNLWS